MKMSLGATGFYLNVSVSDPLLHSRITVILD